MYEGIVSEVNKKPSNDYLLQLVHERLVSRFEPPRLITWKELRAYLARSLALNREQTREVVKRLCDAYPQDYRRNCRGLHIEVGTHGK